MGFCPISWGQAALNQLPSANFDLQKYIALAEKFTQDEIILQYINNVLSKAEFQEDPEKYIQKWKQDRGDTEGCRFPEDRAARFFYMHFMKSKFFDQDLAYIDDF